MTVELSYQAQIKAGWTVQPTFQYVTHPGGHTADPDRPERGDQERRDIRRANDRCILRAVRRFSLSTSAYPAIRADG